MSRKGLTTTAAPSVKMSSWMCRVSEQESLKRGWWSQKKWGTWWEAQKDRWAISRICRREWTWDTSHAVPHYPCGIVEGVPDGHVAVIGHGSQEAAVSYTQGEEEVHLGQTASQGDGAVVGQQVGQHLRYCDGGKAEVSKGQVGQQEVHGSVKGWTGSDGSHNESIT